VPELHSPDSVELQEFRSELAEYREMMQSRATAYKDSQYTLALMHERFSGSLTYMQKEGTTKAERNHVN
jgi:hypothetical protein